MKVTNIEYLGLNKKQNKKNVLFGTGQSYEMLGNFKFNSPIINTIGVATIENKIQLGFGFTKCENAPMVSFSDGKNRAEYILPWEDIVNLAIKRGLLKIIELIENTD